MFRNTERQETGKNVLVLKPTTTPIACWLRDMPTKNTGKSKVFLLQRLVIEDQNERDQIIHSFILPLTRNTTTVYRNTLKIIYNIPTNLFTRLNVVKAK